MSPALMERLEYVYDNHGKLLLISDVDHLCGDSSLVVRCADSVAFNRLCGPLMSATANPADKVFVASVGVSPGLLAASTTLSSHVRHGVGPQDLRHPSIILILCRKGKASLQVGGTNVPFEVAIVTSDVDFTIHAIGAEESCEVSYIMLMGVPDLVARMPGPVVVPKAGGREVQASSYAMLQTLGERVADLISSAKHLQEADMQCLSGQFASLIREQFERGGWGEPEAVDADEVGLTTGNGRDIVTMVQRYLRHHAADKEVTPTRIARHCAVSIRKLYNAFAVANMSLRATILSYRLEEARRQLNGRTAKKVTSIAYDAGFKDVSTFYRNFRREFGYSPRNSAMGGVQEQEIMNDNAQSVMKLRTLRVVEKSAISLTSARSNQSHDSAIGNPLLPRDTLFRYRVSQSVSLSVGLLERMRFPSASS